MTYAEEEFGECGTSGLSADGSSSEAGVGTGVWATALDLPPPASVGGLGSFHEILEADKQAPKKQRHTAKRIFERLKEEHGYQGGKTVIEDAVRAWRQTHQAVFLPLVHPPGEAQVDFGEATIRHAGVERKVALFVMMLPYSGAIFVQAFPRECTETFMEGHRLAFEFFGGVPKRITYDNSAIAVIEVLKGRERKLTQEFLRLQNHYLFQEHFCLVRTPNEKGMSSGSSGSPVATF